MKQRVRLKFAVAICLCLAAAVFALAHGRPAGHDAPGKEKSVANHASGAFEVKGTPLAPDSGDDSGISRMSVII
jgi:hypothetical protein